MIEIAIHRADYRPQSDFIQVARIENKPVVEIDMEPLEATQPLLRIGDIYYAKVVRLLPAMRVAFVEIGEQRTALLHFAQVPLPREKAYTDTAHYLRVGQFLPVQVIKQPRGEKGAVVSGFIQLIGVLLIYQPFGHGINISQRIREENERQRLTEMVPAFNKTTAGIMMRSLAEGRSIEALTAEWQQLKQEWEKVEKKMQHCQKPQLLRAEWPLALCYLRDQIAGVQSICVDDMAMYAKLQTFMQTWLQPWFTCLEYNPGKHARWFKYKVDATIEQALNTKISLPSGGYLVVESTEAMITVDVNTGQSVKAPARVDIVYQTNKEAAMVLVHYLRLTNLAGIIVVDFIGMKDSTHQEAVLKVLQEGLANDKSHTTVYGFSPLGLVEISRQRRANSWLDYYR